MRSEAEASPETASDLPSARAPINWHVVGLHGAVIGGFLLVALIMWWRVWISGHPSSTITCQCGDVSEALGYLAWTPWAVAHGHNPFLSNAIYAGQGGANMLVNTTWIAFALLFAPITWLFGPILTFNVVVTLAPVVSGWCLFLAVRKFTSFVPGQIVAAALYGFSPVIVTSDPVGHFFQIWLIFPPLAFLCLYDLVVTQRHRPALVGTALGLLIVVQFFTSTEVLTIAAVICVICLFVATTIAPRVAWRCRRRILVGLSVAAAVAIVSLAYPLWFALSGPRHIVGYAWPGTPYAGISASTLVSVGSNIRQPSVAFELGGYFGNIGPNTSYIGIPLLAFLAISVFVWARNRLAWVIVAGGAASFLLSLGDTASWTPWRLFTHVPVVSEIIPGRFSAMTIFAVALLLSLSADSWWHLVTRYKDRRRKQPSHKKRATVVGVLGALLSVVVATTVVPIGAAYSFPFVIHDKRIPPWFAHVAPHLPQGTEVLAYPFPEGEVSQVMGWQAVDGMRFNIVGGFAIVPGADGEHSSAISPLGGTVATLDALSWYAWGPLPPAGPAAVRQVRASLHRWRVHVVVVIGQGRDPVYAAEYFTAVLGRLPRVQDGALVWYGLGGHQPLSLGPAVLNDCSSSWVQALTLTVPDCVLAAGTR